MQGHIANDECRFIKIFPSREQSHKALWLLLLGICMWGGGGEGGLGETIKQYKIINKN